MKQTKMMPWLYLHFPSLQLDALVLEQAQQGESANDKPLIIVEPGQNAVLQLNQAALNEGIRLGMGLATAISLSADLVVVEYNQTLEAARIQELAQWFYQVVADIALFEPDGLALEITNMLSLYDGIDNYWAQIETILVQQQVSYQRAFAQTPMAARLLARQGYHCTSHCKLEQNPDKVKQQLGELSTAQLELPKAQVAQLHRVGIHHLAQLWSISTKELGRRFGLEVLNYLGKIKGEIKQPLDHYQPPTSFTKYLELFHEINQSQVLLFPLKRMVQDMADFLLGRELVVTTITITLHFREGSRDNQQTRQVLEVGSAQGEYKADNWMVLIGLKVERTQLEAPVVGITLVTGVLVEKNCTVDDLFSTSKGSMTPSQLVSLLQAKVGKQSIVGIELHQDHRPEFAFGYHPPRVGRNSGNSRAKHIQPSPTATDLPKLRPLILLEQPEQLTEQYTILQGPERVRSAWWGPQAVYRDYFIARNAQGAVCWLFNEPQGSWFLHGYFC